MTRHLTAAILASLTLALAGPIQAGETGLSLELNAATTVQGACRLTFVVQNDLGTDLAALSYEAVVLTTGGEVAELTLLDFREIPAGRPRVRQFDLAGHPCDSIGRILINGANTCDGAAPGACITGLRLRSRTAQELVG